MRIGIDARFYGPRVGGGGIGRYVAELVTHLQEIDHENEYVLFLKKDNFHECVLKNPRFYKRLVDVHWYGAMEQRVMPREVKLARVDLMHYPHWNVPLFSRVPFIVTIHDLILIEDQHSARSSSNNKLIHGFKYAAFRTVLEHAIHRSKHILTVSRKSQEGIVKHFGINASDVTVIPNGILPPRPVNSALLEHLGVQKPYFLYVGNAYPHKNISVILEAFSDISRHQPEPTVVIAGRRDVFSRALEKEAVQLGIPAHRIRFIDLPTDDEIAALYANALLFIYPSRIEGFGMPPLEAMSYGTPVAAARASSLPEVLGPTAHYFDPEDAHALANIMTMALTRPKECERFREAGIARAASYTWRRTAEETLAAYKRFT